MADEELVNILKSGVAHWNRWRKKHPGVEIDLRCANLSSTSLPYADLSGADLIMADLAFSDLSHADLRQADMSLADLHNTVQRFTNMTRANLSRTNLSHAILSGAILKHAILQYAILDHAIMNDINLSKALLFETAFGNVDLSNAKGLNSCQHQGPSILDHRTLLRSGTLPLSFLRGCGLPDNLIEYLPSLLGAGPIQFYSCFISYSTQDQELADRLHGDLQNKGVRCWFASEDLKIGDRFRQGIDDAIRLHDRLLLLLSEHSVKSDWVREEVETCLERESREKRTVLFPVRIDDAVMDTSEAWASSIRRQRHIGDFRSWKNHDAYKKGLDRLLRDLKADAGKGG